MTNATAAHWPAMSIAEAHALLTAPGQPFEMEEMVIRGVNMRVWKNANLIMLICWIMALVCLPQLMQLINGLIKQSANIIHN